MPILPGDFVRCKGFGYVGIVTGRATVGGKNRWPVYLIRMADGSEGMMRTVDAEFISRPPLPEELVFMGEKAKLPFAEARALAEQLVEQLRPACERIEIAGSLRRRKAEIGDIEIVAIPKMGETADLFGNLATRYSLLDELLAHLPYRQVKGGERYKQLELGPCVLDLFLCTPETWGVILTLRTGSAEFSHWLVTARRHGGGMPSHLRCQDGRLWEGNAALDTPEEADVFKALGVPWGVPEARVEGRWSRAS